jgi:hypothetical protein
MWPYSTATLTTPFDKWLLSRLRLYKPSHFWQSNAFHLCMPNTHARTFGSSLDEQLLMVVVRIASTDKVARMSTALTAFEDDRRLILGHAYWTLNVGLLHSHTGGVCMDLITCALLGTARNTSRLQSQAAELVVSQEVRSTEADASCGSQQRLFDWRKHYFAWTLVYSPKWTLPLHYAITENVWLRRGVGGSK